MNHMKPPRQRRQIEREFGVPIAGEILDPARWTQTALKRLPETGPLDWQQLFGRSAPIVLDLGCGNGRYLIGSAVWRPDHDHVGVDILPAVLRYATRRGNQRGLGNLRFAAIDAQRFLQNYVAPHSVREIHIYHPQPFHDPREASRRLIEPGFLARAHGVLEPSGSLWLQTDNAAYWKYMLEMVPSFFEFSEQPGPWPDAPKGRTRREILALRRGLPVFRGWGKVRPLSEEQMARLVADLPRPSFDAGPRHRELDADEMLQ
jgi:tRNA (guanine-N7-)-methyltransferase